MALSGCQSLSHHDIPPVSRQRAEKLDQAFSELLAEHNLVTAGVAVVKNGEVVWEGYYGDERPGKPATETTQFDVASITKTVSTETILRLVDNGQLSLDESMSEYWVDPDITDDPRHELLTPRMALTHTTGFRNWRFFSKDNTLRFVNDPGTTYGYSGEGFEYVARYAEQKLNTDFDKLVQENVFDPIGMVGVSFSVQKENFSNIARPVDRDGAFYGYYCRPSGWCREEGEYSAADDMVITVKDYANFMISIMNGKGYKNSMQTERNTLHSKTEWVDCDLASPGQCPQAQGYGLGWRILDFSDNKLVWHGGSDWSEVALAYFYPESHDGLLIFFNAPHSRGISAMPKAIELIDPDSPLTVHYQMRNQR
ncbi:serine hydrolase domain-containing protein [Fodinibius salsisoli]|uniref:Beta-lactamase family protein n=1 Tax=Fodinibius salsisoli TaxID=2820877 RepID=A0ABT3PN37_9BACT|nr:serine hydrolase domain-containing protein [Fodinibius salsisoli]MCW9707260.1 beta-lactamase family protein [Fodinibius salsisoli]